jgi:hypothetical protein
MRPDSVLVDTLSNAAKLFRLSCLKKVSWGMVSMCGIVWIKSKMQILNGPRFFSHFFALHWRTLGHIFAYLDTQIYALCAPNANNVYKFFQQTLSKFRHKKNRI